MRAALLVVLLAVPAPATEMIYGFNFPVWWHDAYASPAAVAAHAGMAEMGAGWVAIVPTVYTKDCRDPELLANDGTASEDSLRFAIRAAKARGLKVMLKPHADSRDGNPRALMNPTDPDRWFFLYRGHMLRYARLAAVEKCEMFAVGTELALLTLPGHGAQWRSLIKEIRAVYSGPLTYAANWHSAEYVSFWKDLDYIGVDGYYPVIGGADVAALTANWRPWVAMLAALSKFNGRPVIFTEVGLAAQKGANLRPWEWYETRELDVDVQAAYMESFVRAFSGEPWFRGFLYWAWEADQKRTGPKDRSMSIQGKPAEQVLRRAFKPAPPPRPEGNWRARMEALSLRLAGVRWP
ncbi:MAG: hypothetical protein HY923_03325 [Elusimicrobia bacterium]|nr:hypothetical protein [Elusimicrobiota bacterium]